MCLSSASDSTILSHLPTACHSVHHPLIEDSISETAIIEVVILANRCISTVLPTAPAIVTLLEAVCAYLLDVSSKIPPQVALSVLTATTAK